MISNIVPSTIAMLIASTHFSTALLYLPYRLYFANEVHSGYDFPWYLDNLLESVGIYVWTGSRFHNRHHEYPNVNFGSNIYIFDWFFGTDEYHINLKKEKERAKAANLTTSTTTPTTPRAKISSHTVTNVHQRKAQ